MLIFVMHYVHVVLIGKVYHTSPLLNACWCIFFTEMVYLTFPGKVYYIIIFITYVMPDTYTPECTLHTQCVYRGVYFIAVWCTYITRMIIFR